MTASEARRVGGIGSGWQVYAHYDGTKVQVKVVTKVRVVLVLQGAPPLNECAMQSDPERNRG
jgi:hypothetical protein